MENKLKKYKTMITILSLILITLIAIIVTTIPKLTTTGHASKNALPTRTFTKAICNETHCQDYEIHCNKNTTIKINPITGAIIEKTPESFSTKKILEENKEQNYCETNF